MEETFTVNLSPGSTSSLKKPTLPTKPCRAKSTVVGTAFQAAGQASAAMHTTMVLQACQSDLLLLLRTRGGSEKEAFLELHQAIDLSVRVTMLSACAIGLSIAAMVVTERHLWFNLTCI